MSKRRYSSTALGLLASVLLPTAAFSSAFVSTTAVAAPAPVVKKPPELKKASCSVFAVLASKAEGEFPKELAFLEPKLKGDEFAAYKSFKLLETVPMALSLDKPSKARLKSGHGVALVLLELTPERLQLSLELTGRDGNKLLSTRYAAKDGGLLMVGAGEFRDGSVSGKIFVAIQCALPTDP